MLKIITLSPRATLGFMPGPVQSSLWKTSPLNSLGPHSVYVKHNSCTPCRHCDQVLLQGMTIRTALVVSTPWQNMHAQVHMLDYTENNNITESWFSKLCSCIDFFSLPQQTHSLTGIMILTDRGKHLMYYLCSTLQFYIPLHHNLCSDLEKNGVCIYLQTCSSLVLAYLVCRVM